MCVRGNETGIACIYARVSTDRQAEEGTIESQVAALRKRVEADGYALSAEQEFLDDGFSGKFLVRPALERLRDLAAIGGVDRIYVHSPDRLVRRYAYQILLLEEFRRVGVEVVFLNRELGRSPEDDLLLQVQGMIAEFEHAKITERCRRGKKHAAQRGSVSVLASAPYGYRYLKRAENGGEAAYEIEPDKAEIVRRVFKWVGKEGVSQREICRRLQRQGIPSPAGKQRWYSGTICSILKNPAYKGEAAYGRRKAGPRRQRLRPIRGAPEQPRRWESCYPTSESEWISIPVPPIVSEDLFESARERLAENRRRSRKRKSEVRYLLQGLVVCKRCGYAWYVQAPRDKRRRQVYSYYRCPGRDGARMGGEPLCDNKTIPTDLLEEAVWSEVTTLLLDPGCVEEEYRRRLKEPESQPNSAFQLEVERTRAQIGKLRRGLSRLIDSYAEGNLEKEEFEPRIKKLRARLAHIGEKQREHKAQQSQEAELRLVITRLEEFAETVQNGLATANWETKRDLITTLVRKVEVDHDEVNVVFRVDGNTSLTRAKADSLRDRSTPYRAYSSMQTVEIPEADGAERQEESPQATDSQDAEKVAKPTVEAQTSGRAKKAKRKRKRKSQAKTTKSCRCKDRATCPHEWVSADSGAGTVVKSGGKMHWAHKASTLSFAGQEILLDAVAMTDAASHDSRSLEPHLKRLFTRHPELKGVIKRVLDDGAADDRELKERTRDKFSIELVASPNPRGRKPVKTDLPRGMDHLRSSGTPVCAEGYPFDFLGCRHQTGHFLFRAPRLSDGTPACQECPKRSGCCRADAEQRHIAVPFDRLPWLDPQLPQLSRRFEKIMARRTVIERIHKLMKFDYGDGALTKRGNNAFQARLDKTLLAMHVVIAHT